MLPSSNARHPLRFARRLRDVASHLNSWGRNFAAELQRGRQFIHGVYEGALPGKAGALRVQYMGRERLFSDFSFLFAEAPRGQILSRGGIEHLPALHSLPTNVSDVNLTIVDNFLVPVKRARGLLYATHLRASLEVGASIDAQVAGLRSPGTRAGWQAVLDASLSWRASRDLEDFDMFYDTMYANSDRSRFGDTGETLTRANMRQAFQQRGLLLIVMEQGKPVSAVATYTSQQTPKTLFYWRPGIARADTLSTAQIGRRVACNEVTMALFAQGAGYEQIDLGLARAVACDAMFVHKRRLGCDFQPADNCPRFTLIFAQEANARILAVRPLVVSAADGLGLSMGDTSDTPSRAVAALSHLTRNAVFPSLRFIDVALASVNQTDEIRHALQRVTEVPVTFDLGR